MNPREFLPANLQNAERRQFYTSMSWLPLAAGATTPDSFQVTTDAFFVVTHLSHVGTTDSGALTAAPFLPLRVQIRDTSKSDNWFDAAVHLSTISALGCATAAIAGSAPMPLAFPRIIAPGATVTADLENMDGANDWGVFLTFHGFKVMRG